MLTVALSNAADRSSLDLTRLGLGAMQVASTAGELRLAFESMRALPGMSWPELPRNEGLLVAATEQRELARLQDLDSETGLANRRRFSRALRETKAISGRLALVIVRLPPASDLRTLVRAAHHCVVTLRPGDLAARLGARSVGVLLQDVSHSCAQTIAARLLADLVDSQPSAAGSEITVRVVSREHAETSLKP